MKEISDEQRYCMMVDTINYTNKQEMLVMDIVLKYTAAQ